MESYSNTDNYISWRLALFLINVRDDDIQKSDITYEYHTLSLKIRLEVKEDILVCFELKYMKVW